MKRDKRPTMVGIRFTEQEKAYIEETCSRYRVATSALLRNIILDRMDELNLGLNIDKDGVF